ncbi:hypothetical protein CTI12_AA084270 [Artemisia annua]|uniref:Uncharacterized protein n=1 Tax=Artemisia annua TaxID=35608 RepID=A0A2U1PFZ0_ARTAN|nr:hypothetical protein CTI12_AA084270 [Artemisia annua]
MEGVCENASVEGACSDTAMPSKDVNIPSCLGKPLMMDEMIARICQFGVGKTDYARVLVEFDAKKGLKESIRIEYTDKDANLKGTKDVKVVPRSEEEIQASIEVEKAKKKTNEEKKEQEVRDKRQQWHQQPERTWQYGGYNWQEYRKKSLQNACSKTDESNKNKKVQRNDKSVGQSSNVNRFETLNTVIVEDETELGVLNDRMTVDNFLNKKLQPTSAEQSKWSKEMREYFKKQWDIDRQKEKEENSLNREDVYDKRNCIVQTMAADVVNGMSKSVLNYTVEGGKKGWCK